MSLLFSDKSVIPPLHHGNGGFRVSFRTGMLFRESGELCQHGAEPFHLGILTGTGIAQHVFVTVGAVFGIDRIGTANECMIQRGPPAGEPQFVVSIPSIPERGHIHPEIRRVEGFGRTLAAGRDLEEVLAKAGVAAGPAPGSPADDSPPRHVAWDFGDLPAEVAAGQAGWAIRQYPALQDAGDGVVLVQPTDPAKARTTHAAGLARLFVLALGKEAKSLARLRPLPVQAALHLRQIGYDDARIADDFLMALASETFVRDQDDIRTETAFGARLASGRQRLAETRAALDQVFFDAVTAAAERARVADTDERLSAATAAAVKNQLSWLVFPGFIRNVPLERLRHYRRYLEGVRVRLERARLAPSTDAEREALVAPYWNRYRDAVTSKKPLRLDAAALADYRWMVEEYRVSLFAQELRTPSPVSPKRLDAKWAEVMT